MTGEYILLDKTDQPSTSSSSEPEPSEDEEKSSPQEPSDPSEDSDSLALDKVFGFVDYDEVSVPCFSLILNYYKFFFKTYYYL
jgi:hypothetical protein